LRTPIAKLGSFLAREAEAANPTAPFAMARAPVTAAVPNGTPVPLAEPQ
jgi:hypothetical protein